MLPNSASQVSSRSSHRVGSQAKSSEDAQVWVEWRKQLTAYVAWVNSQLKKKPGAHLVEDLRHDVRDGVILIDLIEVIANEKISDIHPSPSTYAQMKENVDRVLQFMFANKIKMHHITTRDIVEGNLKAIMRLVLALAAHYKPNSVRHSTQTNKQNIAGIAQGAAAALTEARRNATRAGHRYRRRRQREESVDMQCSDSDHSQSHPSHTSSHRKSASHVYPVSHQPSHHHNSRHHNHSLDQRMLGEGESSSKPDFGGRAELEGASASSSPVSSHNTSPRASLYLSDPPSSMEGLLSVGGPNRGSIMITSCESDAMTDSGYTEIADSLKDTHQMLFQLHELLLNGENNHDIDASGALAECANPKETITILKARLLHAEEVAENLRSENIKVKHDCRELHGTKAALQQRLAEQENQLSAAKTEAMTFELEKEKLALELDALRKQLLDREQVLSDVKKSYVKQVEDKEKALADLRRELLKRDHSINVLTEKVNHLEREGAVSTRQVKGQMKELATDIKKIDLAGAQLEAKVNSQDYRLAVLADYLRRAVANQDGPKFTDLENIREHYKQTKLVSPEVPPNTVIDSLEDSLVKLLEKVHINGSAYTAPSAGNSSQEMNVSTPISRGVNLSQNKRMAVNKEKLTQRINTNRSTSSSASPGRGSPSRRPVTTHPGPSKLHQVSPRPSTANTAVVRGTPSKCNRSQIPVPHELTISGVRTKTPSPTIAEVQPTNVIYYLENSDKPSTCVVRKKLGEIRLRDLKAVIPDSNLYHYFFKALDPEYGTVKEELSNDDDLLPGWEGKIVAWLEEESGTVC